MTHLLTVELVKALAEDRARHAGRRVEPKRERERLLHRWTPGRWFTWRHNRPAGVLR